MKRQVDIYIEGTEPNTLLGYGYNYLKLDLFDDEKINISSSIQNVQDISKVYTDFSQSFTVPASDNNNKIFEYFYQNDVDNTIDHNLRRYAYIEIGTVPFRTGKIQLEGSSVKNGKVEHYSITFYGDLISLKDTFGNTKINQLDYSFISNPYTGAAVKSRITDTTTNYDIRYPLITSQKLWSYADGTSTDLATSLGRIDWRELFPAIKVSKIFEAIQNDFNITFQSTFLNTDRFKKLFLWCKNTNDIDTKINGRDLPINTFTQYKDYANRDVFKMYYEVGNPQGEEENTFLSYSESLNSTWINCIFTIDNAPIITGPQWLIYIDVYVNGVFFNTVNVNTATSNSINIYNYYGLGSRWLKFKIRSEQSINIKYSISLDRKYYATVNNAKVIVNGGYVIAKNTIGLNLSSNTNSVYSNMPDITVSDFFSGILKQFNLTCYSVGIDTFQIEPLDNWYSKGAIIDVTKHVDDDTITVDRLPLYKNVSLSYQKSESFTNRQFGDFNGREYGDISNNYPYDGGEYKIDVPFENLLFQKFSTTPLQVGYALNGEPDFKPYVPKPVLLYLNGGTTTAIRFYDGTTESTINNVALFGQDLLTNGNIYSLNFSSDNSTWYNKLIDNSLFATYYFGYLSNLFNTKNRLTKLKAYFPISLITSLRLNDRLVIDNKRYIINTINSDITSGEVSLELINDFRKILTSNTPNVNDLGGNYSVEIFVPNNTDPNGVNVTGGSGVNVVGGSGLNNDTIVELIINANPNPVIYVKLDDGTIVRTEDDGTIIRSEKGEVYNPYLEINSTDNFGNVLDDTLYLNQ